MPESIKRWSMTSVQTRLISDMLFRAGVAERIEFTVMPGGSCSRPSCNEVMVSRDMFGEMLEKIGQARVSILDSKTRRQKESSSDSGRSRQGTRLGG